jgi:hypothetical protein
VKFTQSREVIEVGSTPVRAATLLPSNSALVAFFMTDGIRLGEKIRGFERYDAQTIRLVSGCDPNRQDIPPQNVIVPSQQLMKRFLPFLIVVFFRIDRDCSDRGAFNV